jgi:hypothetical protein
VNASTAIRTCAVCGASIDHLRSDATTCGSTCRGRKLRANGPRCGWCSRRIGPGRRYGSSYCSSACERADTALRIATDAARKTDMRPVHPPPKVMTPAGHPDACTRCGTSVTYRDEDGDRWCLMCGRAIA